jgi:hypothetical protein
MSLCAKEAVGGPEHSPLLAELVVQPLVLLGTLDLLAGLVAEGSRTVRMDTLEVVEVLVDTLQQAERVESLMELPAQVLRVQVEEAEEAEQA